MNHDSICYLLGLQLEWTILRGVELIWGKLTLALHVRTGHFQISDDDDDDESH